MHVLSYQLASPCSLAGRYNNPMPELTLFPQSGSMNTATDYGVDYEIR